MSISEYDDYRRWVNDWTKLQPKKGYGIFSRMAEALGTNSVVMSQVFRGSRELNLEQGVKIAQFMSLTEIETDLFLLLVQKSRAGSSDLVKVLDRQIRALRKTAGHVKNRIEFDQISESDKSIFYSSWIYLATWLASTIPGSGGVSGLAKRFGISEDRLREVLTFILERRLLEKKGAHYEFGPHVIHIPHDSPLVSKHHANWRLKALHSVDQKNEASLHYSAPMVISETLREKLREELLKLIQSATKRAVAAPSEKLVCLNIDFFEF